MGRPLKTNFFAVLANYQILPEREAGLSPDLAEPAGPTEDVVAEEGAFEEILNQLTLGERQGLNTLGGRLIHIPDRDH